MEGIIWFLVIGGLFYFMMKHGCGAHVGGHGGHGGSHGGHAGDEQVSAGMPQKVKDPVCGMEIDREEAHAMSRKGGRQVYFCSKNCQDKFNEDPERYL